MYGISIVIFASSNRTKVRFETGQIKINQQSKCYAGPFMRVKILKKKQKSQPKCANCDGKDARISKAIKYIRKIQTCFVLALDALTSGF